MENMKIGVDSTKAFPSIVITQPPMHEDSKLMYCVYSNLDNSRVVLSLTKKPINFNVTLTKEDAVDLAHWLLEIADTSADKEAA